MHSALFAKQTQHNRDKRESIMQIARYCLYQRDSENKK